MVPPMKSADDSSVSGKERGDGDVQEAPMVKAEMNNRASETSSNPSPCLRRNAVRPCVSDPVWLRLSSVSSSPGDDMRLGPRAIFLRILDMIDGVGRGGGRVDSTDKRAPATRRESELSSPRGDSTAATSRSISPEHERRTRSCDPSLVSSKLIKRSPVGVPSSS